MAVLVQMVLLVEIVEQAVVEIEQKLVQAVELQLQFILVAAAAVPVLMILDQLRVLIYPIHQAAEEALK